MREVTGGLTLVSPSFFSSNRRITSFLHAAVRKPSRPSPELTQLPRGDDLGSLRASGGEGGVGKGYNTHTPCSVYASVKSEGSFWSLGATTWMGERSSRSGR